MLVPHAIDSFAFAVAFTDFSNSFTRPQQWMNSLVSLIMGSVPFGGKRGLGNVPVNPWNITRVWRPMFRFEIVSS
jgi:hypothetical protein